MGTYGSERVNPSVVYAGEDEQNSVCANSGRHKGRFSEQRLRMRKAGYCKAQILEWSRETRLDFLETQCELFKKQVPWPHYFILKLVTVG